MYVFFGEVSVRVLCPFLIRLFVFLLLSCSSLCILGVNCSSETCFGNLLSHSMGCFSLCRWCPLKFILCTLHTYFISCAFCIISKKSLPNLHCHEDSPLFLSVNFTALALLDHLLRSKLPSNLCPQAIPAYFGLALPRLHA